jgi:transcriptional regulator with XRE-family HTH domain
VKKAKKSEKLLLKQIAESACLLAEHQRGLSIGQLIALIRSQLAISQRAVAKRAGVPQATISKIESGRQEPTISTLNKILDALRCDLLITAVPRTSLDEIRLAQAKKKAKEKIEYLKGTMSLEKQIPNQIFLEEMIEEEVKRLLDSSSSELWDEEI